MKTSMISIGALALLFAPQTYAQRPTGRPATPQALLAQHKTIIETLKSGNGTLATQACSDLAALGQNSAHHLKAEAQIQHLSYCDRNIQIDPFASSTVTTIARTYPWLSRSIHDLRTRRLLSFSSADANRISADKIVPIYLNAAAAEESRDEKIQLVLKIDGILKSPSTQANATLRSLIFRLVPRYILSAQPSELETIVKDFLQHGEVLPARRLIDRQLKSDTRINALNFTLLKLYRDSFIGDDLNRATFLALSDKAVTWASQFGENELYLARLRQAKNITFRTQGDLALEKLNAILRMRITNVQKAETYLLIGKVYEQNSRLNDAIAANEQAINLGISGEILNRTQFDLGRMYWKQRNFAGAARTFLAYRNRFSSGGSDRAKATFWLARAYVKLNRGADATTLLLEAKAMDKYGYYGMVSARELKSDITAQDLFSNAALSQYQDKLRKLGGISQANAGPQALELLMNSPLPKAPAATHNYMLDLLRADQIDIFINSARYFVESLSTAKSADIDMAQLYLEALQYVGQYTISFEFSAKLTGAARARVLKESPSLFFPAGYIAHVNMNAKSRGLDVGLVLSIIKQESSFNAGIRSPVGAIGLMQLMPQTASAIASARGIKNFDPKTLFSPGVNIDFGTYLVDDLANYYKDRFVAIVGAYNGGKVNVDKWTRYSTAGDEVEFVEDVPFIETRNYMKVVAKNMTIYRALLNPAQKNLFPF